MAERRPAHLDEMASVGGVGAKKLESYGQAFLSVITGVETPMHPARRKMAGRPEGVEEGAWPVRLAETGWTGLVRASGGLGSVRDGAAAGSLLERNAILRGLPKTRRVSSPSMGPYLSSIHST